MNYSIIKKSQLEGILRLDAEYYQTEYLSIFEKFGKQKILQLGDFCKITDGDHAETPPFKQEGKRYLRAKELKDFFIDNSEPVFISENYFQKIKRSHIKPFDIALSIMGTVGNIAIILPEDGTMTANRAVSIISPKSQEIFSSYFLIVYLESKFGVLQRERESMGGVQLRVNLDDLSKIKIPIIKKERQKEIDNIFKKVVEEHCLSKKFYSQAENLLLEELGLKDFENEESLFAVINLSEVKKVNRMDAEYFDAKYYKLFEKIESYKNGYSAIGKEFNQIRNNFKKEKGKLYNYIEISDVDISMGAVDYHAIKSEELPANAKIKLGSRQLITSKVRPNRGATAILENHSGFIGSGAFVCLSEKGKINLETLQVYLKLKIIRDLLLRYNAGTSYPVINDEGVLNLKIPLIENNIQQKITDLVKKSNEARKKAKELSEEAKNKVEKLIENK